MLLIGGYRIPLDGVITFFLINIYTMSMYLNRG